MDGIFIDRRLLTMQMLVQGSRDKKIGVGNSGLAAISNPVSQVLW